MFKIIKKVISRFFMHFVLLFTVIVSVFPILWVIMSSFKTNNTIMSNPFALPESISFESYIYLFEKYDFLNYTINSVIVAFIPTILSLLFFTMGAYVISKYNFPGKNLFYALFTITLLVPAHSRSQPIFSLINNLGLYNTRTALILVYLSSGMAMSIFILKSTFHSIPNEINEAGLLDGASFTQIFFRLNLPLAKTGIVTAGVLMFLANWNEFYYADLLISDQKLKTLPAITTMFNSMFTYNYPRTFAALTVVIVPGIIIYAIAQKQVQESMISSAVKG